ncbi:G1 family glutamic endopeptidase [Caballeronia sp. LZ034LL]|uniref:G1 family glutamic endopeptidase n=1 Tax=Caballeronia sp. LZ034LL TaxID=3038567 RepID=UPI00286661BB|nr:G1 family glutamic endopeptidase [Caballeronia sp. LZ034LL]MDR5839166.1 G1 family endopeptidase [Caballeronia sp. LZ034LL]
MLLWLLVDAAASNAQSITTMPNWAGYVISDATYSAVSASWVVPAVDCSMIAAGKSSASTAWVGLGGFNHPTDSARNVLEQIGTVQACQGSTPFYALFAELFPASPWVGDSTNYPLSAGDTVTAKVARNLDGSFTLSETATAKGASLPKWTFSTMGTAPGTSISDPGNTSAEIIMEQPGFVGSATRGPAASYGSITFFNISYTKASTLPDEAFTVLSIDQTSGNTPSTTMAVPSVLSPTSFIVYQF